MNVEIGFRYGRLTVISLISHKKNPRAMCLCDCGSITFSQRGALKSGKANSCGCKKNDALKQRAKTHGLSKTTEYKIWRGMVNRCTNPNLPEYANYGGRGIRVLYPDFEAFLRDVGPRPDGHWIDRIDNDSHYMQGNCRWVEPSVNQENKRQSRLWIVNGETFQSSQEVAKKFGILPCQVNRRCNGYTRRGKQYAAWPGWESKLKYKSVVD